MITLVIIKGLQTRQPCLLNLLIKDIVQNEYTKLINTKDSIAHKSIL